MNTNSIYTAFALFFLNIIQVSAQLPNNIVASDKKIITYIDSVTQKIVSELPNVKDIKSLNIIETNQYGDMKAYFDAYATHLPDALLKLCKSKLDLSLNSITERRKYIEHTIPKITNRCLSKTLTWQILAYKRQVTNKETRLIKQLSALKNKIAACDNTTKKQQLINKELKLQADLNFQYAMAEKDLNLIESEILLCGIDFCKKSIKVDDVEQTYWGITNAQLPAKRDNSKKSGGLSISGSFTIKEAPFHDTLLVQFECTRQAYTADGHTISEAKIIVPIQLIIHDKAGNSESIEISISPNSDKEYFELINVENNGLGIRYSGNLEKSIPQLKQEILKALY